MIKKHDGLPVFKILLGHFNMLIQATGKAWGICLIFAALTTVICSLSGNMLMCINSDYRATHFCTNSLAVFTGTTLLSFVLECIFARNWAEIALENNKINWKTLLIPKMKDLKIMGLALAYILTLFVALLSFYLLYIRVPNPNWKIELTYFGVVSIGFLFPLLALRFCALGGAALIGKPLPSLLETWKKTSHRSAAIFFAFILTIMLGLFLMLQVSRLVLGVEIESSYLQAVFVEFINNLIKFIMVAIVANFCYLQYDMLFRGDNENEKE